MEENSYIIRSKAVFDSIAEEPSPKAILIQGSLIKKILPWDYAENEAYEDDKDCPLYDYGDKLIMSSFIDAHTHIFTGAITASDYVCAELGKCRSQDECVEMIAAFAKEHEDLDRIRGTGWFIGNWTCDELPDKRSLDAAIPDRPVYLQCADSHSFWLNSMALKEAGIVANPNLENGIIGTFEDGELSGMLIEPAACEPAMKKYMDFTDEEMVEIHENFQKILAENGVAGLSEMFAEDYTEDIYHKYDLLKEIDEKHGLSAQVYVYTKLFGYTEFDSYFQMKKHFDSEHFHIAGVKGFIDGVTETYTGLLLEPYTDRPETCGEGLPLWPVEKMQQEIIAANKAGIQVRLHCIADGSVKMALDMYEKAEECCQDQDIRNTVEHIENIRPADMERFAKLGVIPSMQPYHVTLSNGDKIVRLGEERVKYEWPIKSILKKGGQIAIGTDYPVVGLNPFMTIYAAVTRNNDEGAPVSHNPWEVLTMSETLKAYTIGAARVYHAEKETGTIEPGKKANIIVLSQNLFEIEESLIEQTKVEKNYFEGREII